MDTTDPAEAVTAAAKSLFAKHEVGWEHLPPTEIDIYGTQLTRRPTSPNELADSRDNTLDNSQKQSLVSSVVCILLRNFFSSTYNDDAEAQRIRHVDG